MKYIYLYNNMVAEIIPEIDPIFPEFTIEQRYSPEFLKKCIKVDDTADVSVGMLYKDGKFVVVVPPEPIPDVPVTE